MKKLLCALAFGAIFVGCVDEAKPPTWEEYMERQTMPYVNGDGRQAFAIYCKNYSVCLRLAGMRCPLGYDRFDERTEAKSESSFGAAANVYFAGAQGHSRKWTETRFSVVCR